MVQGLPNLGNSCFFNSVIQAIAALQLTLEGGGEVTDSLKELVSYVNGESGQGGRPSDLIRWLDGRFKGGQEDAQECFQLLLQALERERLSASGRLARSPFLGLAISRFVCRECLYSDSLKTETFEMVFCALPWGGRTSLMQVLQETYALEEMDDATCQNCSTLAQMDRLDKELSASVPAGKRARRRLEEKRRMLARLQESLEADSPLPDPKLPHLARPHTRQSMMARPPPCLVIHLNRSTTMNGRSVKNPCQVQVPEFLNLGRSVIGTDLNMDPLLPISRGLGTHDEWQNVHRRRRTQSRGLAMEALETASNSPPPPMGPNDLCIYRLVAIIVHLGTHDRGHYVTYRRPPERTPRLLFSPQLTLDSIAAQCPPSSSWTRVSDLDMSALSTDQVLEITSSFMLFYKKLDFDALDVEALRLDS